MRFKDANLAYVVLHNGNGDARIFCVYADNSAKELGSGTEIPDFADYWLALREDGWY